MKRKDSMPAWVYLALSSIESRKGALVLVWISVVTMVYCVPWSNIVGKDKWITKLFLCDDWTWAAIMVPVTLWYWMSMKWIDKHSSWET